MITSYPDKNSLKQVFDSELSVTRLRSLCKDNGILLLSSNKDDIINAAHLFFWGFTDINQISDMMEDEKNYKKSFRLELIEETGTSYSTSNPIPSANSADITTQDVFSNFYSDINAYRSNVASGSNISFESFAIEGQEDNAKLKATVAYKRKRKGKVKLLDEVTQRFSFEATKAPEGDRMIVDIIFDDKGDTTIAKKIITDAISTTNHFHALNQISLTTLTTAERVELFDRFLAYTFTNWRVVSVKNIKVQKDYSVIEENEDEDEVEEVENDFLAGIESALFSGSQLRTNPIIVDAVNKGYFFPKAVILFEHRLNSTKLLIDVSFNTDDLLLEVSVVATYEFEDGRDHKHPLSIEEQKEALSYFHGIISQVYSDIIQARV